MMARPRLRSDQIDQISAAHQVLFLEKITSLHDVAAESRVHDVRLISRSTLTIALSCWHSPHRSGFACKQRAVRVQGQRDVCTAYSNLLLAVRTQQSHN